MKTLAVAVATGLVFTGTAHAEPARVAHTSAKFESYSATAEAVTYDTAKVPIGAKVHVLGIPTPNGGTTVVLLLKGLLPDRPYGAHVHVKKCGAAPADAGPHYQNVVDPKQPSVDPVYANPSNEIWLDVHADAHGLAYAKSTVDWQFTDRHAQSVVLHNEHTHTGPNDSGTAGPRLACVNVAF